MNELPHHKEDQTDVIASDREEVMGVIVDALDAWGPLPGLAQRIYVSPSCLYAIRNGKTRWPRDTTLMPLVRALGFRIRLERV